MVERRRLPVYLLIAVLWSNDYLLQYARIITARLPIISSVSVYLIPTIYAAAILLALPFLKVYASDIVFIASVLMVYVISPVIHPETHMIWSNQASRFLLTVIPFYFLGNYILTYIRMERLLKYLYVLSIATIMAKILYFFVFDYGRSNEWAGAGEMDQAYKLLPHICLVCYYVIKKPTAINMSVLAISSAYLLFLGNRGSVLILVICAALLYLLTSPTKHRILIASVIVLVVVTVIFSPLFDVIIQTLEEIASQLGMSIRIFEKLEEGSLTDSSGRDLQAENIHAALANQPILGLGLYGDRVLNGTYAHSIFRELWVDFGYLFGSLIFVLMLGVFFGAFRYTQSNELKAFLIILMGNGFFKLFFSGSYLTEDMFFYVLGMAAAMIRQAPKAHFTTRCATNYDGGRTRLYGNW